MLLKHPFNFVEYKQQFVSRIFTKLFVTSALCIAAEKKEAAASEAASSKPPVPASRFRIPGVSAELLSEMLRKRETVKKPATTQQDKSSNGQVS